MGWGENKSKDFPLLSACWGHEITLTVDCVDEEGHGSYSSRSLARPELHSVKIWLQLGHMSFLLEVWALPARSFTEAATGNWAGFHLLLSVSGKLKSLLTCTCALHLSGDISEQLTTFLLNYDGEK